MADKKGAELALEPERPASIVAADAPKGPLTIEEHAVALGHVNTFDPDSPPRFVDASQQKAFILEMVKVHRGWGIGKRVERAEYEKAVDEVMNIPIGENIAAKGGE